MVNTKVNFKHILVTGGAGYVGSSLVDLLLSEGYKVTVFDNLIWGSEPILHFFKYRNFKCIKGDIGDKKALKEALDSVDVVIHLAAIVGYPACRRDPELSRRINIQGTENLVELVDGKIPIIFASTGSTYGKIIAQFCTETTPINPLTDYGKQKAEAETIIKENKEFVIYRFATAFGVSPRFRLDLLINDFTYRAIKDKSLIVYEKEFMRTFIHVRDMARALLFALEHYSLMKGEIYNVGDESLNFSKEDVCKVLQKFVDFYLHFVEVGHDLDQRDYIVDYSKIKKLGFTTTITLEEGIKELIQVCQLLELKNKYSNV